MSSKAIVTRACAPPLADRRSSARTSVRPGSTATVSTAPSQAASKAAARPLPQGSSTWSRPTLSNPRSRATRARTGPCATSERAVRNRKSSSATEVSAGEVAEKLTVGTPAGPITRSATGSAAALAPGPTTACAPSTSTRRRASSTATAGSDPVSPTANVTGRPNTPPPSLTCRIASSNARRLSRAAPVPSPPKFINSPILRASGSDAPVAGAARVPISANAPAAPFSARRARAAGGVVPSDPGITGPRLRRRVRPGRASRRPSPGRRRPRG